MIYSLFNECHPVFFNSEIGSGISHQGRDVEGELSVQSLPIYVFDVNFLASGYQMPIGMPHVWIASLITTLLLQELRETNLAACFLPLVYSVCELAMPVDWL